MNEYISASKITKKYDISAPTLRRWSEENKIRCLRARDRGKRIYKIQDIKDLLGIPSEIPIKRKIICYARVSSTHQKGDLDRQIESLIQTMPEAEVISEIASGLNFKRKGLLSLLQRVYQGDVEQVVVTYKDRLCRFGIELIEWIFKQHNTKIMVLNTSFETTNDTNELAEDLLAITTHFVAKNNGNRSAKYRKQRKEKKEEEK